MAYQVELSRGAEKALASLPDVTRRRVAEKIDSLAENPRPHGVKKISGSLDHFRVRVGDYRIVYEVRETVLLVLVLAVGHRREIYRQR